MSEPFDAPPDVRLSSAIAISRLRAELCALFQPIPAEHLSPELARLLAKIVEIESVELSSCEPLKEPFEPAALTRAA